MSYGRVGFFFLFILRNAVPPLIILEIMKKLDTDNIMVPFNRSYWVIPEKLMAGCYPGTKDKNEARQKLKGLIVSGIRHVISLMEPSEYDHSGNQFAPYVDQMEAIAESMKINITFDQLPIKDLSIPSKKEMIRILNQIDICMKYKKPVYVHCWGGKGRTGTVIGCYLTRHGHASGHDVIDVIKELRKDVKDHFMSSPETKPQINMVMSWGEGE